MEMLGVVESKWPELFVTVSSHQGWHWYQHFMFVNICQVYWH